MVAKNNGAPGGLSAGVADLSSDKKHIKPESGVPWHTLLMLCVRDAKNFIFGGNKSVRSSHAPSKIEVIGAGWGRTGTNSFKDAMEMLYGAPCYHMKEVWLENGRSHVDFWDKLADRPKSARSDPNFQFVFGSKYKATTDWPSAGHWKEQLEYYPDAKVVLTLHPKGAEGWYRSCMNTIFVLTPDGPIYNFGIRVALYWGFPVGGYSEMVRKCISRNALDYDYSKENIIRAYNEHIETVIRECPEEKLLVFKATDGWEPLCKFLGKPVPDVPYPNVNDSAEFQWGVIGLNITGWIITGFFGVLLTTATILLCLAWHYALSTSYAMAAFMAGLSLILGYWLFSAAVGSMADLSRDTARAVNDNNLSESDPDEAKPFI